MLSCWARRETNLLLALSEKLGALLGNPRVCKVLDRSDAGPHRCGGGYFCYIIPGCFLYSGDCHELHRMSGCSLRKFVPQLKSISLASCTRTNILNIDLFSYKAARSIHSCLIENRMSSRFSLFSIKNKTSGNICSS